LEYYDSSLSPSPSRTLDVTVIDEDGNSTGPVPITVNIRAGEDAPPVITSNGGGDIAAVSVAENHTAVTTVTATDSDGPTLTFSVIGGADQALFQIDQNSGILSFVAKPEFENPSDADHNNSYVVTVSASDGTLSDQQTITVNVHHVNE